MAWIPVPEKPEWEFSDSPDTDKKPIDHYNYNNNVIHEKGRKKIFSGEKYVLARQRGKISPGYGEIYVKDPPVKSLFENRPGLWFDPQDLTTMYQDAAGALPVYRPGAGLVDPPVGLMLDKSRGLELGPELVANEADRTFSGDTGFWNKTANAYISDGVAGVTNSAGWSNGLTRISFFTLYRWYQVSIDVVELTGTGAAVIVGLGTNYSIALTSTGRHTVKGVCLGDTTIRLYCGTTNVGYKIDNISIREIKGYHAYQPTPTARPTLSGRYNILTATETLSTQSVTTAATTYTFRFEGAGTVTLSGMATGVLSAGTHTITCTAGNLTLTVAGSVTKADLRVKRGGTSLPPYQRVDGANTYDTNGFPLYIKRDKVDDDLIVQAPAITGAWAHGTIDGPVIGTVAIPAGEYHPFGINPTYGLPDCTQWIAIDGTLSASEQAVFEWYVYSKARQLIGADQFGCVTTVKNWFSSRSDITGIDTTAWDTPFLSSFDYFAQGANNLSSFDIKNLELSNATLFRYAFYNTNVSEIDITGVSLGKCTNLEAFAGFTKVRSLDFSNQGLVDVTLINWIARDCTSLEYVNFNGCDFRSLYGAGTSFFNCTSLTTFIVGNAFDNTPCTNFANAFINTNLNQASIDAILVSINNAGTSNGTFAQSGGSAPSATGQAAITAMRSRGWTVITTKPVVFQFDLSSVSTFNFTLQTKSGLPVLVDWGNGTTNTYAGVTDQTATKTYAASGNYTVKVYAEDDSVLTKFSTTAAGMSGTLSLPSGMTFFSCTGPNTLSGTLSLPSGMTFFRCDGNNTLSGTLSLPSGITTFTCQGNNTLSGTLSLPSNMIYFYCTGSNTLSGYTPSAKASNQQRFYLTGQNTLSATDVDNILIDYAAAGGTWTGLKDIVIQGNAANRTSASDAAYASLATKLTTLDVD